MARESVDIGLQFLERGLRLRERGARLGDLLIEFRGFDLGHELAGFDAIADIDDARLHVAIGAREDGGFDDGLQVARQVDAVFARG